MIKLRHERKERLKIANVLNDSAQDALTYKKSGVLSEEVRASILKVSKKYIDEMTNMVDAELKATLDPTFKEDMHKVRDILVSIHECNRGLKQCNEDSQEERLTPNDLKLINIKRAKFENQKAELEIALLEAVTHAEGTTLIGEPVGKIADVSNTAFENTLNSIDTTISTLQVQLLALKELRLQVFHAKTTLIRERLEHYVDMPINDLSLHKSLTTNKPLVKTTFKL